MTDSIVTPGSLLLSSDAGTFATGIIFGTNGTVNLFRSASDTLRTDDSFSVGGTLTVTDSIVTPGSLLLSSDAGTFASGIIFGTANTANLYRLQPDTLRTDDNLIVGTSLAVGNRILVSSAQDGTMATQGIIFGLSEDTNLYRSQPNQLKTDDSLVVGASLAVDNRILVSAAQDGTTATQGIIYGLSEDTNLYRSAVGALTTDTNLTVGGTLTVSDSIITPGSLLLSSDTGTFATGIIFGTNGTVNLYRSASDTLRTDDSFSVGGTLTVTDSIVTPGSLLLSSDAGTFASGIIFGTANTANLYRSQPDTLTTDDNLVVGTSLAVGNRILVSSAQDSTAATNGILFGLSEDTNLYRSQPNQLKTDDSLVVGASLAVDNRILVSAAQDGTTATQGIIFGLSEDTNLYRSATNALTTDDSLSVAGTLTVTDSIVTPGSLLLSSDAGTFASGIIFGTANTANLYRLQPDTLRTDDNLVVGASLAVANRILVSSAQDSTTATNGIIFGLSEDTNLYRSKVNQLNTGDSFFVGATLAVTNRILVSAGQDSGVATQGIVFGLSEDTNLYRSAANVLRTDDAFLVGATLAVTNRILVSAGQDGTTATNGIIFGISEDTNLFRSAANTLRTSDSVIIDGSLTVTGDVAVGGSLSVATSILVSSEADGITSANGIVFGLSTDTNLYRSKFDQLKTDDSLFVGASSLAVGNRILVSSAQDGTSATQGIIFGLSEDTNLYRSATNALTTDDSLSVAGTLTVTDSIVTPGSLLLSSDAGTFASGIIFGTANTANLYRLQPDTLRTDDSLVVGASLAVANRILVSSAQDATTDAQGITFGLSEDTNLFRSAANTLQTSDSFIINGSLTVSDNIIVTGSISAGTSILVSSLADGTSGDTGIIFGSSRDTNLYRSAANTLSTDDSVIIEGSLTVTGDITFAGNSTVSGSFSVGTSILVSSAADGTTSATGIVFGPSRDTNLYRIGANVLATDDAFLVGATLAVTNRILVSAGQDGTSATNGIIFGLSEDTNLYRSAANVLRTDDAFLVGATLAVTNRILVSAGQDDTTATNGIIFGLSEDTNLYRSAANVLRTDDAFLVGATLAVTNRILASAGQDDTTATNGIIFGLSEDTNLYRSAVGALTTDTSLIVAGTLTVTDSIVTGGSLLLSSDAGTFATGIIFGTNGTVNLYRSASDTLRTDDSFSVGGTLTVTDSIITPGSLLLSSDAGTFDSGIIFGTAAGTVNLYRSAANTLTTDDSFTVTGSLTVSDNIIVTGSLSAGTSILVSSATDSITSATGIVFGSSRDTNLYRIGADVLVTDDAFLVGATLAVTNRILVSAGQDATPFIPPLPTSFSSQLSPPT